MTDLVDSLLRIMKRLQIYVTIMVFLNAAASHTNTVYMYILTNLILLSLS